MLGDAGRARERFGHDGLLFDQPTGSCQEHSKTTEIPAVPVLRHGAAELANGDGSRTSQLSAATLRYGQCTWRHNDGCHGTPAARDGGGGMPALLQFQEVWLLGSQHIGKVTVGKCRRLRLKYRWITMGCTDREGRHSDHGKQESGRLLCGGLDTGPQGDSREALVGPSLRKGILNKRRLGSVEERAWQTPQ